MTLVNPSLLPKQGWGGFAFHPHKDADEDALRQITIADQDDIMLSLATVASYGDVKHPYDREPYKASHIPEGYHSLEAEYIYDQKARVKAKPVYKDAVFREYKAKVMSDNQILHAQYIALKRAVEYLITRGISAPVAYQMIFAHD